MAHWFGNEKLKRFTNLILFSFNSDGTVLTPDNREISHFQYKFNVVIRVAEFSLHDIFNLKFLPPPSS